MFLQVQLSFAPTREDALRAAHEEWGTNVLDSRLLTDLRMPADFEAVRRFVRPDDVTDAVRVSDTRSMPTGFAATSSSASNASTCTTFSGTSSASSQRSASTCCQRFADAVQPCSGSSGARRTA
jgi:hypothetical protein